MEKKVNSIKELWNLLLKEGIDPNKYFEKGFTLDEMRLAYKDLYKQVYAQYHDANNQELMKRYHAAGMPEKLTSNYEGSLTLYDLFETLKQKREANEVFKYQRPGDELPSIWSNNKETK
jgi:hypothetical protein